MKVWIDVGSRWAAEVGEALGFASNTPVLGLSEEVDYQGSCHFVARPKRTEIVVYGWSYGSCSGCDGWEGLEDQIGPEVRAGAKRMTVTEFRKYAKQILSEPAPEYDGWPSMRKAVAEALENL